MLFASFLLLDRFYTVWAYNIIHTVIYCFGKRAVGMFFTGSPLGRLKNQITYEYHIPNIEVPLMVSIYNLYAYIQGIQLSFICIGLPNNYSIVVFHWPFFSVDSSYSVYIGPYPFRQGLLVLHYLVSQEQLKNNWELIALKSFFIGW